MQLIGIISRGLWVFLFTQTIQYHLHLSFCSCKPVGHNETDRLSLLAFKSQIADDPFNVLSSWNNSVHFCKWAGVTCGRKHKRVVELHLNSIAMAGTLSPRIGNLSFLRILDLSNNSLSQDIPDQLGHLFRLRLLRFTNNSFSGGIPASLSNCSSLQILALGRNKLVSKLPSQIGSLSQLQILAFPKNELMGGIPSSFGNLSSLENFFGGFNNLNGGIPEDIGKLEKLQILALDGNNLEGNFPISIFNLSNLNGFSVYDNKFTGSLPYDVGLTLPNIGVFQVAINRLSGPLPATLSNASNLVYFNVDENNFTGRVPILENLINLEEFLITSNNFGSGRDAVDDLKFLYSLSNSTNLREFTIENNQLWGEVPQILSNFSEKLETAALAYNQLSGSIPREIGNLINLQRLRFHSNLMTGTIPESIGKLRNLVQLYLYKNNLSGSIPYSLGNATSLSYISLSSNALEGRIPPSVGNLKMLVYLNFSGNELIGMIPKELFGNLSMVFELDMGDNQLIGPVPTEIGKLVNLEFLDISSNKLSGEVPTSLSSCIVLEKLYLQENFFGGSVPSSWSSMSGLQSANLSHNNLSGEIPKFLEDLKLMELDLSFNNLEGEVPSKGVFQNMSGILIAGNKKICGGAPALNLSRCVIKKPKSSFSKLKRIILISGGISITILVASSTVAFRSWRRKNFKPAEVTSSGVSFPQLSYEDLLKATNRFSIGNLIGKGGFGDVYEGILGNSGQHVAVKVLNLLRRGANKSFMAECEALANIRHRNLVKVITACSSIDFQGNDFKAIIYEYMGNGSLEKWLHPTTDEPYQPHNLSLVQRLDIAIDVANALQYLHQECEMPLVHCDLKPSNIMMDMDMVAHLADFGLARFLKDDSNHNLPSNSTSSISIKGTIGYAAPEYGMGSEASTQGDIYSFGILLLEMFTRKGPSDEKFQGELTIHNYVKMAIPDHIGDFVDPGLLAIDEDHQRTSRRATPEDVRQKVVGCLASILMVGVGCSAESPRDRMDIGNVLSELHRVRNVLVKQPTRQNHCPTIS